MLLCREREVSAPQELSNGCDASCAPRVFETVGARAILPYRRWQLRMCGEFLLPWSAVGTGNG